MPVLSRILFFGLSLVPLWSQAQVGARIDYFVSALGGNQWRYDYSVENTGTAPFDEFTIYFASERFSELALVSSPPTWDSLVIQPDPKLPAAGFFDALSSTVFASGASAHFSVSFRFLIGGDTPSAQPFDIVDPITFRPLATGMTTLANVSAPIPEPPAVLSLLLGLGGLLTVRRRKLRRDEIERAS